MGVITNLGNEIFPCSKNSKVIKDINLKYFQSLMNNSADKQIKLNDSEIKNKLEENKNDENLFEESKFDFNIRHSESSYISINKLIKRINYIIKIQNAFRKYYYRKKIKNSISESSNSIKEIIYLDDSINKKNQINGKDIKNEKIKSLKKFQTIGINKYIQIIGEKSLKNKNDKENGEEENVICLESPIEKKYLKSEKTMIKKSGYGIELGIIKNKESSKGSIDNMITNNQVQLYSKIFTNLCHNSIINSISSDELQKNKKKEEFEIGGFFLKKRNKKIRYFRNLSDNANNKEGYKEIIWTDNSKIKGIFTSNHLNGFCQFLNGKNGAIYEGYYQDDIPRGFGIYKNKIMTLEGYWDEDNMNEIGIEVWDDGTYYQGEFFNSKKNGIGLYRWNDGTIYQGEFKDNQMKGTGIILYNDDRIYSGEISDGVMDGYGIHTWGNGNKYMGFYLQGAKHGFGIFIWGYKPFVCYVGFWLMGKQQGVGAKVNGNTIQYCLWNKGKIITILKGLYEIDKYLSSLQMKYYKFFNQKYINKIKSFN